MKIASLAKRLAGRRAGSRVLGSPPGDESRLGAQSWSAKEMASADDVNGSWPDHDDVSPLDLADETGSPALVTPDLRAWFASIHENGAFQWAVILVIILSALLIGANTYELHAPWRHLIEVLDASVTIFFLIEILIRIAGERQGVLHFFRKGWNVFDFVIVTMSMIPIEGSQLVLIGRLLRVFRVLRLVSIIPDLRFLLNALFKSIPRMGYVGLLMFIIFYIYGAIGSFLFEKINPTLWGDVSISMLTLFRVATFEDWTDIMYETMEVYPLSWIFYLTFIFLAAFVFLNMMIGVILDVMQREHLMVDAGEGVADLWKSDESHALQLDDSTVNERLARIEQRLDAVLARGSDPDATQS